MKSYGTLDSPGMGRLREILEDVSSMSRREDRELYVGEDAKGRIVATANEADSEVFFFPSCIPLIRLRNRENERDLHIAACRVYGDEFSDRSGYGKHNTTEAASYTIDEIMQLVHDVFVHGIIRYGPQRFPDDEDQLMDAIGDAERLATKYGRPFILGMTHDEDAMVAPMIREPEFVAPASCVITGDRAWRLSDICSEMYAGGLSRTGDMLDPGWHEGVCDELASFMENWEKKYGRFTCDGACLVRLGRAFEDAAKIAVLHKQPFEVLLYKGMIYIKPGRKDVEFSMGNYESSVGVAPGEFMDGGVLSLDKIAAAARDAHEKFLPKYEEFAASRGRSVI